MALNQKKFLDSAGLTYFAQLLDNYPDNEVLASVIDAISDALDEKVTICYGTCATAADTAQKAVTIDNVTELTIGLTVLVKFTYSNTVASPTLKINNLDAKAIKRYGTTAPSTSAASSWNAGSVVTLTYDGTYWQMHDWLNTTYSAMSQSEMQTGTATSGRNITAARLKEAIQYHAPVTDVEVNGTSVVNNGVAEIDIPEEIFVVTITYSNDGYSFDKTYAEIISAYNSGKHIVGHDISFNNYYYITNVYEHSTQGQITFSNFVSVNEPFSSEYPGHVVCNVIYIDSSNQIASEACQLAVPTRTSHLTNDSGYLTLSTLPIYDGTVV